MAVKKEYVSFGDETLYVSGSAIPEGDYALKFENVIDRGKEGKGAEKLMVKVKAFPLPFVAGAKVFEYRYGYGSKAHLVARPDPDDNRRLVKVPNGPNVNFQNNTKWAVMKDSLHQSGLERGILTDTFEAIDGVWVHISGQPEPKEWADMNKNSDLIGDGDEPAQGPRKPGTIPVVTLILEGGKPWDGNGGGIPEEGDAEAAPAKTATKAAAKPAAGKKNAAPVTEDIAEIAGLAFSSVLGQKANENGCSKTALKTGAFTWIKSNYSEELATKFMDEFMEDNDLVNGELDKMGYKLTGLKVTAAE